MTRVDVGDVGGGSGSGSRGGTVLVGAEFVLEPLVLRRGEGGAEDGRGGGRVRIT